MVRILRYKNLVKNVKISYESWLKSEKKKYFNEYYNKKE